ncbi:MULTISPECIES: RNA-protein complex protein Nop10 [Methanobrevibacter]|jgi:H/ACA ribonucleoprotein complex subunit 3|uniref:RNA-protein complex protein Nop10 n=1 Tax=Methanobrevibacter TaxID=2172 RepID=UPI002A151D0B|nr:RNA-protein complex protein Nop10 [Methanobacteriaceae archaeon]MDD4594357.1 RNA-protein complex protein Nop10 [Methanobacteriaceae archaeon]
MKMKMRKCPLCDIYTIKDTCPNCGGELKVVYPPKYSIEDKYGKYRRKLKEEMDNK